MWVLDRLDLPGIHARPGHTIHLHFDGFPEPLSFCPGAG
jgi:hypothetical protein